jgi:hypothetical protein
VTALEDAMSVYTVHEPPLRAADAAPDPERFVFVRDGFYVWAFLLTPLWLLSSRLWLAFLIYLVVAVGIESAMHYAGIGTGAVALVVLVTSLLVGFEAATLRRFALARRGWKNVGVVSGENAEAAERRFFDVWVQAPRASRAAPSAVAPAAAAQAPHTTQSPDIVGLFPDPRASR